MLEIEYAAEFFRIAISFPSLYANYSIQILYCYKKNGQPFRRLTFSMIRR